MYNVIYLVRWINFEDIETLKNETNVFAYPQNAQLEYYKRVNHFSANYNDKDKILEQKL